MEKLLSMYNCINERTWGATIVAIIIILTVGKYVIALLIILNIAMHQFHCELICKYC